MRNKIQVFRSEMPIATFDSEARAELFLKRVGAGDYYIKRLGVVSDYFTFLTSTAVVAILCGCATYTEKSKEFVIRQEEFEEARDLHQNETVLD